MQAKVLLQQAARYNGKNSESKQIHGNILLIKANEFILEVPKLLPEMEAKGPRIL